LAVPPAQRAASERRMPWPAPQRPYRTPFNITVGRAEIPIPAVVGSIATFLIWILALATHPGARYAGPVWLAVGLVVFVAVRRLHGEGLMERVTSDDERHVASAVHFRRILVPMKIGLLRGEMLA